MCICEGCLSTFLYVKFTKVPQSHLPVFLLQARNSYSNEVVAIKKMSYNGKQTTEVRKSTSLTHLDSPQSDDIYFSLSLIR